MKPKTLLVLLALVAALGAFIGFVERDLPSTDERAERSKKVLGGLAAADVTALVVERDGVRLVLERQAAPAGAGKSGEAGAELVASPDGNWRITAPLVGRADAAAVDALVSQLVGLPRERTVEGADRQAMGLAPPRAKVTLRTAQGERVLEVGADVPASMNLALAVDGGADLAIAPRAFFHELTKAPGDWRARDLFPGRRDEIETIALAAGGGSVRLAQRDGELRVESPFADRADRDEAGALLADLTGLRAERFLDGGDVGALGLAPARATIEVTLAGRSEPFRLELGGPTGEPGRFAARAGGQLVELSGRLAEVAGRAAESWRARAWSSLDTWSVDALTAKDASGTVALTRHEGDWKRDGTTIPYVPIGDLLAAVAGLKAERFDEPAAATGEPALTLELAGSAGRRETLTLFVPRDGLVPARAAGRDVTLLLPVAGADELRAKLAAVRQAKAVEPASPSPSPGGSR